MPRKRAVGARRRLPQARHERRAQGPRERTCGARADTRAAWEQRGAEPMDAAHAPPAQLGRRHPCLGRPRWRL